MDANYVTGHEHSTVIWFDRNESLRASLRPPRRAGGPGHLCSTLMLSDRPTLIPGRNFPISQKPFRLIHPF